MGFVRWIVTASPIGDLAVAVDDVGVCQVRFAPFQVPVPQPPQLPVAQPPEPSPAAGRVGSVAGGGPDQLTEAGTQLAEYFAGERTGFDLPLSVRRGSDFERAVWAELTRIPYGETRTYGQIAAAAGDPGAARAVGVACNRNPLPVLVPCHRVVGAGGKLVGFGGGLPRKRFLLDLESGVAMRLAWS